MVKRILAAVLCMIMLIGIAPLNITKAKALSGADAVGATIADIRSVYKEGTYFSCNRYYCAHNCQYICDSNVKNGVETDKYTDGKYKGDNTPAYNCVLRAILNSEDCKKIKKYKNSLYNSEGGTCWAFASFCFTQCFGCKWVEGNYNKINSDYFTGIDQHNFGSASNSQKYNFFKQAKIGDIIAVYNWGKVYDAKGNYLGYSKYASVHYMVFISCDSTGITVYDNNCNGDSSHTGNLRYGKINYSGKYGLNYSKYEIHHAKNYNEATSVAAQPTMSTSVYEGGTTVTLKSATSGAAIYYTTNGSNPTTSSTKYTGTFNVSSTATVKAIAVKSGSSSSSVLSQTVTVNKTDTPIFNEPVVSANVCTLTFKEVKDTSIYYTVDGTDPYLGGIIRGEKYNGAIQINKNTVVKAIAIGKGKSASNTASKTINISVPEAPILTLISSNSIGIGDEINLSWTEIPNTCYYTLLVNGKKQDENISGSTTSFVANEVGEYNIQVTAVNFVGESEASSPVVKVKVNPDVTVTFKDYDGKVISSEKIHYGKDASVPVPTSREGYSFSKWNGKYTNVKEDTIVTAQYTPNTYTITFVNENGKTIGTPQSVDYGKSATAPSAPIKTGYDFVSWSVKSGSDGTSYTCVDGNATFEPVYVWSNTDLPLGVSVASAIRNAESYSVTAKVTNSTSKVIYGKMIAVIKTENDKIIAQAINQIQVPANASEKEYTININSKNNAMLCEVYIVGNEDEICNDRTGGALSLKANCSVTKNNTETYTYWSEWSSWSTTPVTASQTKEIETKTQYRYSDRDVKTSYDTTMSDYTKLDGVTWVDQGNTDVLYVKKWPTGSSTTQGFNTDSCLYKQYNNASLIKSSANNTSTYQYNMVSESIYSYLYWHWCSDDDSKNIADMYGKDSVTGKTYTHFHAFESKSKLSYNKIFIKSGVCSNINYWASGGDVGSSFATNKDLIVYKYTYKTYRAQYSFEKWSSWSAWSDTEYTAIENSRKVETRTLYRYKTLNTAQNTTSTNYVVNEDLSGKSYSVNGTLQNITVDYSGKTADVLVYKGKNSDATESQLEYIGQVRIGEGNSYSFSFIPKEEITEETGDYIVSFSIATATRIVNYVDVISAPKPTYKVEFKDLNGIIINTQNVEQGKSAVAPELAEVDGYNVKWNKTFTNITTNTVISAQKEEKTYNVIFIDYENDKVIDIQEVKYGAKANFPDNPTAVGMTFTGWSADEKSIITETTVITAEYTPIMIKINFLNNDGSVFETKEVAYGSSASVPESNPTAEGYEFVAWDSSTAWWDVKKEVSIKPIFIFDKTVETPVVDESATSLKIGAFDIETSTEDANIYFTTDGTEPTEDDLIFEDVVFVEETTVFKAKAFKVGMNPSDTVEVTVTVVPEGNVPSVSALTDIEQYEIGEDYAKICMKIENPNRYPLISYGYYITKDETGDTDVYENTNISGLTDDAIGKVFTINGLSSETDYSYDFFVKFDIDGEERYFDTATKGIGKSGNGFTTSGNSEHIHSYTSVVINPTCETKGYTIYTCPCGDIYKDNYVDALNHTDSNDDGICDTCKKLIDEAKQIEYLISQISISAPTGSINIGWKYKAKMEANANNLPDGYYIQWFEGDNKVGDEGISALYQTDSLTSSHTYTAKIVDASGNVVSSDSQNKTVTVNVKTGFFDKILSFFSKIFGSDVTTLS